MIVSTDKSDNPPSSAKGPLPERDQTPSDPPPAYEANQSQPSSSLTPTVKPTNFVAISRNNSSIRGQYFINPLIEVPAALLPPLPWGRSERKNLSVESSNGTIDLDVTIEPVNYSKKVKLHTKTSNGTVKVQLRRQSGIDVPPVHLNCVSSNGTITVCLPRSFRGPATITTKNGSSKLSEDLAASVTTFSDVKGTWKCFIGDADDYIQAAGKNWPGDELTVETSNGCVRLRYIDEEDFSAAKNFFAKLFSW